MKCISLAIAFVAMAEEAYSFRPAAVARRGVNQHNAIFRSSQQQKTHSTALFDVRKDDFGVESSSTSNTLVASVVTAAAATGVLFAAASPAEAADTASSLYPIKSAVAAYVHYLSIIVGTSCLVAERLTVKPGMSEEEENFLTIADSIWGITGLTLVISGYYRAVEYGKGWEFYSHEPIFWLKLVLLSVVGGASFFPTTTIIKRAIEKNNKGSIEPMSEELANRMKSVINAEISGFLSIPLTATLMSRGVFYMDSFPWQAGAAVVVAALGGVGFKYVKEALDWKEPITIAPVEE